MDYINKFINDDWANHIGNIPDGYYDMILEDMPYNNTNLEFDYAVDLKKYWESRLRIIKENGVIVLTAQQPFATDLISSCRKYFRYELIWRKAQKLGFLNANKMPLRGHENILIFYKKLPTYNPQKYYTGKKGERIRMLGETRYEGYSHVNKINKTYKEGEAYPDSVLEISNWNKSLFGKTNPDHFHPTQKPVELFQWLIRTYTNEGDIILDGYAGSGTTAIACKKENRRYTCFEWDKEKGYYEKAIKRLEAFDQQLKLAI
jgi:site-specific DNA-methyltransferase (adenine-specific)